MATHDPRAASHADHVVFIKDEELVKELKYPSAGTGQAIMSNRLWT